MLEVDWLGEISKYLGLIVAAGGGGAAVVFGVFQAWGKGWLDSHFDKRLEDLRHEQNKEVERLKLELNISLDRSQRLNHLEFEALPRVWQTMLDMHDFCSNIASAPVLELESLSDDMEVLRIQTAFYEIPNDMWDAAKKEPSPKLFIFQNIASNITRNILEQRFSFNAKYLRDIIYLTNNVRDDAEPVRGFMLQFLDQTIEFIGPVDDPIVRQSIKIEYITKTDAIFEKFRSAVTSKLREGI